MAGGARLRQLLAAVAQEGPDPWDSLGLVLRRMLRVDDVVLCLAAPVWPIVAAATGDQARALEERQLLVGDGPTVEALRTARPVRSRSPRPVAPAVPGGEDGLAGPDGLPHPDHATGLVGSRATEHATVRAGDHAVELEVARANRARWPLLASVLGQPLPYAGHVAVPLTAQHGPPVGIVSCYARSHDAASGATSRAEHALVDLRDDLRHVLSVLADGPDDPGGPGGPGTEGHGPVRDASRSSMTGPDATSGPTTARERRAHLHMAAGMVAVQIEDSPSAALARMRAHAYVHDTTLHAVARDVLAHRLHLRP